MLDTCLSVPYIIFYYLCYVQRDFHMCFVARCVIESVSVFVHLFIMKIGKTAFVFEQCNHFCYIR